MDCLTSMLHTLRTHQIIKTDINTLWDFMSSPENLAKITPSYMGFHILGNEPISKMFAGQIIEYTVKPIAGIPMYWATEITQVVEKQYFIDEQRFGPYTFWHHLHRFKPISQGVEMTDTVHYKIPLGVIGKLVGSLFIHNQVKAIFEYREKKLNEMFNC